MAGQESTGSGTKRAARHLAIYSIGTISRQLVGFVMLPVYTRLLSPADYGVVALLAVMISVFELVLGARFSQAVPKFYFEDDDAGRRGTVVSTALITTAMFSTVGVLAIAAASTPISTVLFGSAEYAEYVAIYAALLLTIAVENYGLTYLRLKDKPIAFVTVSLAKLLAQLSLNIWFVVVLRLGVAGVVYAAVLSSALFAAGSALYVHADAGVRFDRTVAKRFLVFSWPLWIAGGASLYISSVGPYLIRVFDGLAAVGLYQIAYRFSALVGVLVWAPFAQWWQPERFRIYQNEGPTAEKFEAIFIVATAVLSAAAVGVSMFGAPVIRIMAAPPFHSAVLALPWLVFAHLFGYAARFMNFSFLVTEKTFNITMLRILSAVLITIGVSISVNVYSFVGAAAALALCNLVVAGVTWQRARQVADIGLTLRYPVAFCVLAAGAILVDVLLTFDPSMPILESLLIKALLYAAYAICVLALVHYNSKTRFATQLLAEQLRLRRVD